MNRFEVLSQTESIEFDITAFNPTSKTNDPESNLQQEKITHLSPPIMVKGVLDFISLRTYRTHRPRWT